MAIDYQSHLKKALNTLFKDCENNGFWDPKESKIIYRLDIKNESQKISWSPDKREEYRYGPYSLMGAIYWRLHDKSSSKYDDKMIAYSKSLRKNIASNGSIKEAESGLDYALVLCCLSLSSIVFPDLNSSNLEKIKLLEDYISSHWSPKKIKNNQDLVIIYSYVWLHKLYSMKGMTSESDNIGNKIHEHINYLSKVQIPMGAFDTGDKRYKYHQRMFLPLWGFFDGLGIIKSKISKEEYNKYLISGQKGIEFIIQNRMYSDGSIFWHEYFWLYSTDNIFGKSIGFNPRKNLFYEVHQCIFSFSISRYYELTGDDRYNNSLFKSIDWIFANNKMGKKFIQESGLDVPFRLLTKSGDFLFRDNNFKGSYEIGIYIMALTDIIKNLIDEK